MISKRIGARYKHLVILGPVKKHPKKLWVKCDCGKKHIILKYDFERGKHSSCGCHKTKTFVKGQKIGHLTVLYKTKYRAKSNKSVLWKCKCVCGKVLLVASSRLAQNRKTASCGCRLGESRLVDSKQRAVSCLFCAYKTSSKKRGHYFKLSKEHFQELILKPCFYCGTSGSNLFNLEKKTRLNHREGVYFKYNGIDRIDNDRGYIRGNVVSCCSTCNKMKSTLSQKEFIQHIKKILNNYGNNK